MTDAEIVALVARAIADALYEGDPDGDYQFPCNKAAAAVVAALTEAGRLVPEGGPGVYVVRDLAGNPWWREFFGAVLRLCDVAPQSLDEDFVRRAIGDLDAEPTP